jgi:hypothetical protein
MGDGRIFLGSLSDTSFYKIYRMSLLSAGSISLDRTFQFILISALCMMGVARRFKTTKKKGRESSLLKIADPDLKWIRIQ